MDTWLNDDEMPAAVAERPVSRDSDKRVVAKDRIDDDLPSPRITLFNNRTKPISRAFSGMSLSSDNDNDGYGHKEYILDYGVIDDSS